MAGDQATPPMVTWAQRQGVVFLTICLEDCSDPEVKIEPNSVHFKGVGGTEKKPHEVTINLFKEVDPEKSASFPRGRNIEIVLKKKQDGPYWPQLTKEKQKFHWLKVDFNKWKDEDDSDEEGAGQNQDLDDIMRQIGGLGGGQGGEMDKPSFDDLDAEEDSDDEGMPDLEATE
ncbi:prostaglandin E synthase 3 isoform X2 [Neocloeon triangulifer]|uniref:prostaglandin E synthase 3 isoform X2 n=1 Tax=Neocloeon triangulifer TaxID=2078957 RepID=UPI00286EF34D|nr:prostaglandin E synthase 3 isoform X2 [Neocloeon triangulifer]